jgi:GPH family glycoside/pentoside/hexuronide:cation symporter
MNTSVKLSFGNKLRFGVGDFGSSVITAVIQFYMLFYYTDVVGINPALAGTAMLIGKLTWDMVNDGLFGYIIDKTKSKWGRRRPYLMFGSIPMALSFWALFSLPTGMSDVEAFFAIMGTFVLFDTFVTFVQTAYQTMTAELTTDYNERTSIATTRMVFNVIGYIFGAAITTFLALYLKDGFGMSMRDAWSIVGLAFGGLGALTLLITGFSKGLVPVVDTQPSKMLAIPALLSTFKNKPFVMFCIIQSIMSISFSLVTTMLPYFIIYQMTMESAQSLIMLLWLWTLALFLVPCKLVADKMGKHNAYALGTAIACCGLLVAFFLPHNVSMLIYGVAFVAGLGFSSQWVCPHSMMPDVIEYDELMTGERREGVYYGMWSMTGKITGALGSALCGWGLALFGYVEGAEQSPTSLLGIRLMFTVLPAVLLIVCIPLLLKYPITRKTHAALMEELNKKREGLVKPSEE